MSDLVEGVAHSFFFIFLRYSTMISSIILRALAVLLKCFGFMPSQNEFANQNEVSFEQ